MLGAVRRAQGSSYNDLAKDAVAIGFIVAVVTFLASLFGIAVLSTVSTFAEGILIFFGGVGVSIFGSLLLGIIIGFTSAIALFVGALLNDLLNAIEMN